MDGLAYLVLFELHLRLLVCMVPYSLALFCSFSSSPPIAFIPFLFQYKINPLPRPIPIVRLSKHVETNSKVWLSSRQLDGRVLPRAPSNPESSS